MRRSGMLWTVLSLMIAAGAVAASAEEPVTAVAERDSIVVRINDEIFTALRSSSERRKPFFSPVVGPQPFERLQAALKTAPPEARTRQVLVVTDTTVVRAAKSDEVLAVLDRDTLVTAQSVTGDSVLLVAPPGRIARRDVAPVAALVTRLIDDAPKPTKDRMSELYYDHPHHKGIWFAVDEVNGVKYWNEDGVIRNISAEIVREGGESVELKLENHWLSSDEKPVLRESTLVRIHADRLFTYDVTLTAVDAPVTFGDTKEGMFAIRLPNSMREYAGGGPVTNADGLSTTKQAWGKTSSWVNYNGSVAGQTLGVAIFDHPANPWPSRYHVRDYGLFALNPFGERSYGGDAKAPQRKLEPGESWRFQFALWPHDGRADDTKLNAQSERLSNLP